MCSFCQVDPHSAGRCSSRKSLNSETVQPRGKGKNDFKGRVSGTRGCGRMHIHGDFYIQIASRPAAPFPAFSGTAPPCISKRSFGKSMEDHPAFAAVNLPGEYKRFLGEYLITGAWRKRNRLLSTDDRAHFGGKSFAYERISHV